MIKNRLLGYADIQTLHAEHLRQEAKIWKDLEESLYQKYLKEGYYMAWARIKAEKEVLQLRSKPKNVHPMPPKGEFPYINGESLD